MFSNRFWIFACLIFVCVSFSFCDVREAVATIRSSSETLGMVTFRQEGPGQPVTVTGVLNNLRPPNALHGFHIHELGNISAADCTSAKTHWNPYRATHGDINAPTRHIGDLSNLKVDSAGSVQINFQIPAEKMPLVGPDSIIGRALVVHQGEDDLGLGGQTDSSTTGHAGGRLGCGVIGLASEFSPAKPDPGMQPRRSTAAGGSVRKAIAVLRSSTGSQEYGVISFVQESGNPSVHVSGMLRGISLASVKHGFHVHQFGNVNCTAAGTHYNPDGFAHAGLDDAMRHVGDLGNINVNSDGTAKVDIRIDAKKLSLVGPKSIVGRTLVLHEGEDDLGLGTFPDSKTTGHAGGRLGCGVIGIDSDFSPADCNADNRGPLPPPPYN